MSKNSSESLIYFDKQIRDSLNISSADKLPLPIDLKKKLYHLYQIF